MSIYGVVLIYVVSVDSVVIIFYKILFIEVLIIILFVYKKLIIWLMDKIGFLYFEGKWNNVEVKIMLYFWIDKWLEIFFIERYFIFFV